MVPHRNLIRACLGLLPLTALAPALPGGWAVAGLAYALLALLALLDLACSRPLLAPFAASVRSPARLSRDREGQLLATLTGPREKPMEVEFGLPLPPALEAEHNPVRAILAAGEAPQLIRFPVTARRRGRYLLEAARLQATSRLRLWELRRTIPFLLEIRVYSDLSRERKNLSGFFLRREQVGMHALRQLGKGREFEQLREYIPGDSYEDIHWKATAKRNEPVTKLFRLERTQDLAVVLDHSRLTARSLPAAESGPWPESALERMIEATLLLFLAAEQQGDRYGLVTFARNVTCLLKPGGGNAHLHRCQDTLYRLHPETASADFDEVFTRLRVHLRRRTLILFLTDLSDPLLEETFRERLHLISRRHLVLVHCLRDPLVRPLFGDGAPEDVDGIYQRLAGHIEWNRQRHLRNRLRTRGISMETATGEQFAADLVNRYLAVKSRQIL